MIQLVVLGGTGDVYLVCALVDAFRRAHHRDDVAVVTREKFGAVCRLFPNVPYQFNEQLVHRGENDIPFQHSYDNRIDAADGIFYTHPCFERSRVRVDHLTCKPDVSQADMYRMLLRVPAHAPLTPATVPVVNCSPGSVVVIPRAVSWPNTQPVFWERLVEALAAKWRVTMNDPRWSMDELFNVCAGAEWVIGPQCGVMSILVTGEFPCRKTLATPSVDEERSPGFLASETFPYGYVTKFANRDYDVEEFKVDIHNRDDVVRRIASGQNARRLWTHDPRPVTSVMMPLSPGDALDRLAVLTVKRDRFTPANSAAIEREFQRHIEATRTLRLDPKLCGLLNRLVLIHETAFELLQPAVSAIVQRSAPMDPATHEQVIRLNRQRVDLKREIDACTHAPYTEVKSYYGSEDAP